MLVQSSRFDLRFLFKLLESMALRWFYCIIREISQQFLTSINQSEPPLHLIINQAWLRPLRRLFGYVNGLLKCKLCTDGLIKLTFPSFYLHLMEKNKRNVGEASQAHI